VGSIASPLGPCQTFCFTNQTYSSSNVRKIAYVIPGMETRRVK
jgi:hypothetical protein